MILVPYLRTSTDDRGQNPLRQADLIGSWAVQNSVRLLSAVTDEGTSASKHPDPLERPAFKKAIKAAKDSEGCSGIVVDVIDRLTRGGVQAWSVAKYVLQEEHGLEIYHAEAPPAEQNTAVGEFFSAVKAMLGRTEAENHRRRVKSGMDRARLEGKAIGRPRKPHTRDEILLAVKLREEGLGWDRVAMEINTRRGIHEIATPALQKARRTSGPSVRRAVMALGPFAPEQKGNPTKLLTGSEEAPA